MGSLGKPTRVLNFPVSSVCVCSPGPANGLKRGRQAAEKQSPGDCKSGSGASVAEDVLEERKELEGLFLVV